MCRRLFIFFLLLVHLGLPALAFVVEDIRIEGLERISAGLVFTELPIRVGDDFTREMSGGVLSAVYRTAWFDDVQLLVEDASLIIRVRERPGIAGINIEGNTDITEEVLLEGFQKAGIGIGDVYNETRLNRFRQELIGQYYSCLLYTSPSPRDRQKSRMPSSA